MMQLKIKSFFKPYVSSSSSSYSSPVPASKQSQPELICEKEHDESAISEKYPPEIRQSHKRRAATVYGRSEEDAKRISISHLNKRTSSEKIFSTPRSTTAVRTLNKKRSYVQLHLELGQSDFLLRTCPCCGFAYAPGDEADEKNHNSFHRSYTHGYQFKGWRDERVVHLSSTGEGRVIMVLDGDPTAHRNKVQEVVKMMEIDLGDGWILNKHCKVYLLILSRRIAGCLIAEPIREAFKVISHSENRSCGSNHVEEETERSQAPLQLGEIVFSRELSAKARSLPSQGGAIICEEKAQPAICGVRAIWVSPTNRRKGRATLLLEALRLSFCSDGAVLDKSQLAFSQPTSAAMALASNYFRTSSFLVYKFL